MGSFMYYAPELEVWNSFIYMALQDIQNIWCIERHYIKCNLTVHDNQQWTSYRKPWSKVCHADQVLLHSC
jgi:hypothetical protein